MTPTKYRYYSHYVFVSVSVYKYLDINVFPIRKQHFIKTYFIIFPIVSKNKK